jgi:nicotinamidase/pyrazinamidase
MVDYDATTAFLVVDVQNDFADPAGGLYVPGGEDVVPLINHEVQRALEAGATVVYTQDWHPEHTPHFAQDGGIWPVHCVRDSWGAAFHPDLEVAGEVVRKGVDGEDGYSGFTTRDPESHEESATTLERLLREAGAERVVIAGLATDYCVHATGLDARRLGFATTVLTDAIRGVDLEPGDSERRLDELRAAGVVLVASDA